MSKFSSVRRDQRYLTDTFDSIVKSMENLDSFNEGDLWALRERLVTLSGAVTRLCGSIGESLVEIRND